MQLARTPKEQALTIIAQKQKPYEYTITYVPTEPKSGKVHFSIKEIMHLTIGALLVIGIGLSIGMFPDVYAAIGGQPAILAVFTAILTTSFFMHEIAHKITAQRKGLWAEFRLTLMGAILTLFSVISPLFKIISPGAVMVAGLANRESIGKISIAGPATNIALSTMFLAVAFPIPQYASVLMLVAAFNAWIALFNLIPFGILDGFKVFQWNRKMWALAFIASLVLSVISYTLISVIL
jgi:Zn-dependent protease